MQIVCGLCVFLAIFLIVINGKQIEISDILTISSGTSFGRCIGYCRQSISVLSNPSQVIASREANFNQGSYPPTHVRFPIVSTEWIDLLSFVNLEIFQSLNDRIGCPDCADGGAEWIQIDWTGGSKRVTFDNGGLVNGIEGLITKLRQIRQVYLSKM